MIPINETFNGTFPFAPHVSTVAGYRMHYVDEGEGPVVLCLHGEPTWGYLFRELISRLAADHRVIVPDHMGFGKSETPADRTYWLQDHIQNLEQLVLALDLRAITLVMHDFGGPVGMGLAARHPERIARIISLNAPVPFGQPELAAALQANAATAPWFQWILQAEAAGTLEQVLTQLHYHILSTLHLNGFERKDLITDTWLAAWRTPFTTPADTLGALGWAKGFATGAHVFETPSAAVQEQISRLPAMAVWGMADQTLQATHFLPLFRTLFPAGQLHELPGVGHYSPEDAPENIGLLVRRFLDATPLLL
ncbi:alpha/beta fold hydrolase [Chitinophaga nivalis]|uniref:Alpha/beta fold hydrolase n=1 Tax=Chitinophaga nivalis TaxID=2991709 RepID=A0ABT3IK31_9BACT|nr:alpha/beta fold hydrolase [Chitinophaga nivalis]MCW3466028.1 alpha/beta fold hydrolase [Chitinophaga nivalis]MCW3484281.1 alpha/beta fold hydrolase [Chitinophaga nivalis]